MFIQGAIINMSKMRGPAPIAIKLSEKQHRILEGIIHRHHSPQCEVVRARIIVKASLGKRNQHIADDLGVGRPMVVLWRRRWADAAERLEKIESQKDDKELRIAMRKVLADSPRSGCPGTFTPEQICQIVALACEATEDSDRPVSEWTHRELTDEVIKRGIVESISVRSVGRFLKSGGATASQIKVLAHQRKGKRSAEVRQRGPNSLRGVQTGSGT